MDASYEFQSQTGNTNSVHLMGSGTFRLGSSWSSNVENWSSVNNDDNNDDDDDDVDDNNNNNNNNNLSCLQYLRRLKSQNFIYVLPLPCSSYSKIPKVT